MASTVVGAKLELTGCLSSDTSCASPPSRNCASNNAPIGIGFVRGQIGDLKNGVANVTVMETEGQVEEEVDEVEVEEGEGDEEETVFPHEPGLAEVNCFICIRIQNLHLMPHCKGKYKSISITMTRDIFPHEKTLFLHVYLKLLEVCL